MLSLSGCQPNGRLVIIWPSLLLYFCHIILSILSQVHSVAIVIPSLIVPDCCRNILEFCCYNNHNSRRRLNYWNYIETRPYYNYYYSIDISTTLTIKINVATAITITILQSPNQCHHISGSISWVAVSLSPHHCYHTNITTLLLILPCYHR